MKEFYIQDDNIPLHAKLDMPSDNPDHCPLIILIHGFTGHMEERHVVAAQKVMNACGYAVLRVEMYGHGKSGGTFESHTILKWVSNILTVIEYAKSLDFVTDLLIAGHSQGGLLTILAAGMCPDAFKALIPLSPALMIPDGARKGNLLGISFDPNHIPDIIEINGFHLKGNYIRTAQLIYPEEEIKKYHGPVLIVHGSGDETVPLQYSKEAAALYDHCTLSIIPDDTHCYDHHLDQMEEAIRSFLTQL